MHQSYTQGKWGTPANVPIANYLFRGYPIHLAPVCTGEFIQDKLGKAAIDPVLISNALPSSSWVDSLMHADPERCRHQPLTSNFLMTRWYLDCAIPYALFGASIIPYMGLISVPTFPASTISNKFAHLYCSTAANSYWNSVTFLFVMVTKVM